MVEEVHIAGIVVHASPGQFASVERAVRAMPGARLHAMSPDGKLVVTLEAASAGDIADAMTAIRQLDAVLSASLVYQHNESAQAMMEEVSDGDHPPGVH